MAIQSIGEELQALFNDRLLSFDQVSVFIDTFGAMYFQTPEPLLEDDGDTDPTFTFYCQLCDDSFVIMESHSADGHGAVEGIAPNGTIDVVFELTPEQLSAQWAAARHLLQRIKTGESADALIPDKPASIWDTFDGKTFVSGGTALGCFSEENHDPAGYGLYRKAWRLL